MNTCHKNKLLFGTGSANLVMQVLSGVRGVEG
jgi:hypothetical protein